MATIRSRTGPRGTTYAVLFREGGKQTSETFPNEVAAQQFLDLVNRLGIVGARRVLEARDGVRTVRYIQTVAEQVVRHISALTGCEPGTLDQYRVYARELAGTILGSLPIDCATRDDVAGWIQEQESRGSSGKTIKNKQNLIASALARAVDDELLSRNVAHKHRIAKTSGTEMVFLTPSEFLIVLARATPHYRPLLIALFGTGMRLGEATALRVGEVSLDARTPGVTIVRAWKKVKTGSRVGPPKTDRGRRTISLPREVVDVVRPLLVDKAPGDLVFVNMRGTRIMQSSLHELWTGWIKDVAYDPRTHTWVPRERRLGKHPRIHDLRHSHASWMLAQGCSLFRLQYRLGHESIQTTADRYSHLQPDSGVRDAAEASWVAPPEPPDGDEPKRIGA